jgi:hypothetical protein
MVGASGLDGLWLIVGKDSVGRGPVQRNREETERAQGALHAGLVSAARVKPQQPAAAAASARPIVSCSTTFGAHSLPPWQ